MPEAEPCWRHGCSLSGRRGCVRYQQRGGDIALTLCDEHARAVQEALHDRDRRWGVLVTSHEPSRVIVESPLAPRTGRYRATFVTESSGEWPTVLLRRSLHSREMREYIPQDPRLFRASVEVGVKFELREVADKLELDHEAESRWPVSLVVQRVLGGYTDRQAYLPLFPSAEWGLT